MSNGERLKAGAHQIDGLLLKAKKSIFFNYSIQVNSLNKTSADANTRPWVLEVIFLDCRGFRIFERTKLRDLKGLASVFITRLIDPVMTI